MSKTGDVVAVVLAQAVRRAVPDEAVIVLSYVVDGVVRKSVALADLIESDVCIMNLADPSDRTKTNGCR